MVSCNELGPPCQRVLNRFQGTNLPTANVTGPAVEYSFINFLQGCSISSGPHTYSLYDERAEVWARVHGAVGFVKEPMGGPSNPHPWDPELC